MPVLKWLINSVIVSISSAFLTVLIDSMAAYGYARMTFKGNHTIYSFLMFTIVLINAESLSLNISLKEDKSTVIVSSTAIKIGKDSVSIQDYESTLKLFDEYALLFSDKVKDGLFEPLTIPDNPAESVTFEKCKA